MPELPEVETIVRELIEAKLVGKKIIHSEVFWPRSLQSISPEAFSRKISNQTISQISRRGKFIVFTLTDYQLLVHLRMTGKFAISHQPEMLKHIRIQLGLNDGRILSYEDQRKFGKWLLLDKSADAFKDLGLEPLSKDFTLSAFQKLIHGRSTQIKSFLLNQKFLVGLGNIYVDEALWEAKIHPLRKLNSLSEKEIKELYRAIPKVLEKGITNQGTTLGSSRANYFSVSGRRGGNQHQLNVFRQDDLPCPRCGTIVQKIRVAQRGSHFCPNCQRI